MSDLYLILHKVRGEPAFDIATKLTIGDEEGWLIPTSGHRAYPVEWWDLDDLYDGSDMDMKQPIKYLDDDPAVILGDCPDHYAVTSAASSVRLTGLLEKLGLKKKPVNLVVRGF